MMSDRRRYRLAAGSLGRGRRSTEGSTQGSCGANLGLNLIDAHVGKRIRLRRLLAGINQAELAQRMGITLQQVHRYECGVNRVGASRLFDLARLLDVPIAYFFDEMGRDAVRAAPQSPLASATSAVSDLDLPMKREMLELIRAFNEIADTRARRRLVALVKALGRRS